MRIRPIIAKSLLLLGVLAVACGSALIDGSTVGLPNRTHDADLSRVTAEFRRDGGNAFIDLTGVPTSLVVESLQRAGLQPPAGASHIFTFDSLRLSTAWGRVTPGGVDRLVQLKFVTAIQPSADQIYGDKQ